MSYFLQKNSYFIFFCLHLYCMTTLVVTGNWTLFWLCTVGYFDQKICHIKVTHFDFFGFLDLLSENLQAEWDRIKFLWFALRKFSEIITALTDTFRFVHTYCLWHTTSFWNIIVQWISHDDLTEKPVETFFILQ